MKSYRARRDTPIIIVATYAKYPLPRRHDVSRPKECSMCHSEEDCGGSRPFQDRDKAGKAQRPGLLTRLWEDDNGAVLATEWALITTLFLIGLVPALLIIRQGLLSKMLDISGATQQLDESYG